MEFVCVCNIESREGVIDDCTHFIRIGLKPTAELNRLDFRCGVRKYVREQSDRICTEVQGGMRQTVPCLDNEGEGAVSLP